MNTLQRLTETISLMRQSAIEKKERNSDRPMSEASIEARAVLSVLDELESIIAPAKVTPCTCGFVHGQWIYNPDCKALHHK